MKKITIILSMLIFPAAFSFGQLSVSGVAGKDGYQVLRASFDTSLFIVPGLSAQAKYAMFERDNQSTMSRYALGLNYHLPFIEIAEVGAEFGYQPKANQYSAYYYDIHGALDLHEILFRLVPADELKFGLGMRETRHSFYDPIDSHLNETDVYAYLYQQTGGFDTKVSFTKAVNYSADTDGTAPPPWLDIPGFISVTGGYLDYSFGANAGYTYKFLRPYAAYNFLKIKGAAQDTDDLSLGLTVQIAGVNINGAVEWLNFSRNTENRQRYFSFSAGVKLF
ncbi:MAG: hypothetical protein LBG16_03315 [Elusimicrobiota bacterium]|jgi:hypothetical protein|nr:hypothetical protein [Elusimicrobiota bacterium]